MFPVFCLSDVKPVTKFRIPKKKRADSESNNLVIVCKEEPGSDSEPELRIAENENENDVDETRNDDELVKSEKQVEIYDPLNIKVEPEVEKVSLNSKSPSRVKQLKVEVASEIPLIKEELVDLGQLAKFIIFSFKINIFPPFGNAANLTSKLFKTEYLKDLSSKHFLY